MENNPQKYTEEFDKVCHLLTPKYSRENHFSFSPPRKSLLSRIVTIGSIAAVVAVIISFAAKSFIPVSAKEVAESALSGIMSAENIKIIFETRAKISSSDEIYSPDPHGYLISGTLYIHRNGENVLNRVDWDDAEKNSIIFTGSEYLHLINDTIVARHPSALSDELLNIMDLNLLKQELKTLPDKNISMQGNTITVKNTKGRIQMIGEFRRDNKCLEKAIVLFCSTDGDTITVLKTLSIDLNEDIPESKFIM